MKIKYTSVLIALLAVGSQSISAQEHVWSLDSCITYARANNIQVQKSELQTQQAEESLKEAKAALFPSLTASTSQGGSFSHTGDNAYNASYGLNAGMTLFNGGKNVQNIRRQRLTLESQQYEHLYTANSIELSIIKAYYQIMYARESVLTNREVVATSEQQLERTKELFKVGRISKVELAQMESQYQSDLYQLVLAENTEAQNILNLTQLLQLPVDAEFAIEPAGKDVTPGIVPDKNEVIQIALSTLPELKAAQTNIKGAELDVKMAKAEYWPTVSLNASASTSNSSTGLQSTGKQLNNNLGEYVGVNVSIPIFDNRSRKTKVNKANLSLKDSELTYDNTVLDITNTIAQLHLDAVSASARYQAAQASLASAKESYSLVEEKYNLGMQTPVDLLVEKDSYLSALQEQLQSKYTALLDLRLLEFYMNR
jgi:outer membrane protein